MRVIIAAIAGLTLLTVSCSDPPPVPPANAGVVPSDAGIPVRLVPSVLELGNQPCGSKVPFSFRLENQGSVPARIQKAETSCGCAVLDRGRVEGAVLQPGHTMVISGELTVLNEAGMQNRTIGFSLSTGDNLVETRVEATVTVLGQRGFDVLPSAIDFGVVELDKPPPEIPTQIVSFRSLKYHLVADPVCSSRAFVLEVRTLGGNDIDIVVMPVLREFCIGPNIAEILLQTDDPNISNALVSVSGRGRRVLMPSSNHLFLRTGDGPKRVSFSAADDKPVELMTGVSGDPAVIVAIDPHDHSSILVSRSESIAPLEDVTVRVTDSRGRNSQCIVSAL